MPNLPDYFKVALTEMDTLTNIQSVAIETARTIKEATGRGKLTNKELREIADDQRPFGFNIQLNKPTKVTKL